MKEKRAKINDKSIIDGGENMEIDLENILTEVIQKLKPLDKEGKQRVLDAISTFYSLGATGFSPEPTRLSNPSVISQASTFSDRSEVSPKEFLREKAPKSDIEKVVCLAYFLSHYRGMPHFKTIDVSKLNTEAAQLKFSNAAYAVDNASKRGFLVPAGKNGMKQISSMGEQFVAALPNRGEAKAVLEQVKTRKAKKSGGRAKDLSEAQEESETK